jgi:hypothetical protein
VRVFACRPAICRPIFQNEESYEQSPHLHSQGFLALPQDCLPHPGCLPIRRAGPPSLSNFEKGVTSRNPLNLGLGAQRQIDGHGVRAIHQPDTGNNLEQSDNPTALSPGE